MLQYKGAHRPLPEIARELGVDGVLEGSISKSGDRMHITIRLIRALNDTHVWAESYDREANDLVSLPREAAQAIAKRLNRAVLKDPATRYVSPEARPRPQRGSGRAGDCALPGHAGSHLRDVYAATCGGLGVRSAQADIETQR